MPDYQQGKIYLIWSPTSMDIYIGSTVRPLWDRMSKHKNKNDIITSKAIIELGNAEIELIEAYPCNSKQELEQRERWYIENALYCINKVIPGRTKKEYHQQRYKDYYEHNKTRICLQKKIYQRKYREKKKLTLS